MREQIKELLGKQFPAIDFESSNELIDDGILDSLTIVGILAAIQTEFDIILPYEEIVPENFNSLDSMAELVAAYVE